MSEQRGNKRRHESGTIRITRHATPYPSTRPAQRRRVQAGGRLRSPGSPADQLAQREPTPEQQARQVVLQGFVRAVQKLEEQALKALRNYQADHPTAESDSNPNDSGWLDIAAEHRRAYRVLCERYGCTMVDGAPHAVVTMGQDDGYQLGDPSHVAMVENDTNKDEYPPSYLPASLQWSQRAAAGSYQGAQTASQTAAGGMHSVATYGGTGYSWGTQDDGALGRNIPSNDDTDVIVATPTAVEFPTDPTDPPLEQALKKHIVISTAGDSHSAFLNGWGQVMATGMYKDMDSGKFCDHNGRTCHGCNFTPVVVPMPDGQRAVQLWSSHSFNAALLEKGDLVTWGMGHKGELARSSDMVRPDEDGNFDLGTKLYMTIPVYDDDGDLIKYNPDEKVVYDMFLKPKVARFQVPNFPREVLDVACGGFHFLVAVREGGEFPSYLYSSGLNSYGQLGHGDHNDRHVLTKVDALEGKNIAQVAAGEHFSLALNLHGDTLWAFGRGDYGSLGTGIKYGTGSFETSPVQVPFPSEKRVLIDRIEAGDRHAVAITNDGDSYFWGFNETGATGHKVYDDDDIFVPTKLELEPHLGDKVRAVQAAGGGQHSLMVVKRYRKSGTIRVAAK